MIIGICLNDFKDVDVGREEGEKLGREVRGRGRGVMNIINTSAGSMFPCLYNRLWSLIVY